MPKRRPEHVPQRSCAVCRRVDAKRSLTRLVRTADGGVIVDPTGRAAGRGAYVCDDLSCREPARLADALGRALRARVDADGLALEVSDASA